MVYRCKNCGGVLEYSIENNKMVCSYCNNTYSVDEVSQSVASEKEITDNSAFEEKSEREHPTIKMQIVRCTSCGAELAVNEVEVSTFCAYCGQATVVQDRVDDYLKPDYIIPFKVSRNDAERIIRAHLNKGTFVPKEIKKFEVEKIRGIYIPYWLFDLDFKAGQYWKFNKKRDNDRGDYEYYEARTIFKKLSFDASRNLNDDSSSRLEPYDLRQLKEFDMAYLSGYYSDRFDEGVSEVIDKVAVKAEKLFSEQAQKELYHKDHTELVKSVPEYKVVKSEYALFPAWFLTFNYEGKPYTILVNGQTGKVVGAVPYKYKAYIVYIILALIFCTIGILVFSSLSWFFFIGIGFTNEMAYYYFLAIPLLILIMLAIADPADVRRKALKKSIGLSTESKINKFSKERQDR